MIAFQAATAPAHGCRLANPSPRSVTSPVSLWGTERSDRGGEGAERHRRSASSTSPCSATDGTGWSVCRCSARSTARPFSMLEREVDERVPRRRRGRPRPPRPRRRRRSTASARSKMTAMHAADGGWLLFIVHCREPGPGGVRARRRRRSPQWRCLRDPVLRGRGLGADHAAGPSPGQREHDTAPDRRETAMSDWREQAGRERDPVAGDQRVDRRVEPGAQGTRPSPFVCECSDGCVRFHDRAHAPGVRGGPRARDLLRHRDRTTRARTWT